MKAGIRNREFIKGNAVDRLPVQPLVMQWAAKQAGVPYGAYCQDHKRQVEAMGYCIENYGLEWVHPSGFAYCEAEAYGLEVEYPEDGLPHEKGRLINNFQDDINKIRLIDIENHQGMMNRVKGVALYKETYGNDIFLCGHMEGPLAEYSDLRGLGEACMDFFDYPDRLKEAFSIIVENAKRWAKLQVEAGAVCMSIGDAACSQIGPDLYREYVWEFHKELASYVHSLGAMVEFHICGDISPLIPMLIETGANIIDVDHLVHDLSQFVPLLGKEQVFCGNLDPVSIIQNGTPEKIITEARKQLKNTNGKVILSGGCEITIDTPLENYLALTQAAKELSKDPNFGVKTY